MIYVDVTSACLLPLQAGIPRTTRQIHRLLVQHQHDVQPLCWQPFRRSYTRLSKAARCLLEEDAFSVRSRPPRDTTLPFLLACLRDLVPPWPLAVPLSSQMTVGDIFLLTSLFPDNRLSLLKKLSGSPGRKIAIFHDAIPLQDANVPSWEKKRHLEGLRAFSRMNLVIAVSETARRDLLRLWKENGIYPAPTQVIPWPVPFSMERPAFLPPPEAKNILYVSRLKQVKNHAALLQACENLWLDGLMFSLDLIGCEDEAKESAQILKTVERLQSENYPLTWRAQVSETDLHAAYRRSSFTVFPSTCEGFGLPIIESFWHGRAVICSRNDAMGEVSHGGGGVQIDIQNITTLTETIRLLLKDEDKNLALAKQAYARPQRTWDDYWREFSTVLHATSREAVP